MPPKQVTVSLQYTWTFNHKDWRETNSFIENIKDIKDKADYDGIDTFHHLNQLEVPDCKVIFVEEKE